MIGDEAEVPSVNVVDPGGLFPFKAGEVDEGVQLVVESGEGFEHLLQIPQDDGALLA